MNKKIYVAGHNGLVGSALMRALRKAGYKNIIYKTHKELDLTDRKIVCDFICDEKPDWIFLAAAKVGGIMGNKNYPVDFLLHNLQIQNNVIEAAHSCNIDKLLFLGSSCIYPRLCPQPIKEEYLLSSALEPTNEAYAIAKIAGIKLCNACNKQYGRNFLCVMPPNLYGPNDTYHLENAHAFPMLLRRFHEAKIHNQSKVVVWGTGQPRREFMYVDDLANACLFLMENFNAEDIGEIINIGTGEDCTISHLCELIQNAVGFAGTIEHDETKPDGTPQKLLDVTRINQLGWKSDISLGHGLEMTYQDFLSSFESMP